MENIIQKMEIINNSIIFKLLNISYFVCMALYLLNIFNLNNYIK